MLLRAAAALACAAAAVHAFTLPVPSLRRHGRSALRARAVDEFVVKRLEQVRDLHPPASPVPNPLLTQMRVNYDEMTQRLGDPDVMADGAGYTQLTQEHARAGEAITAYDTYVDQTAELVEARELLTASQNDAEMAEMAEEEVRRAARRRAPATASRSRRSPAPPSGLCA